MTTLTSEKASESLGELIRQVSRSHEPVPLRDDNGSAILLAEEDWRAIQETLYLLPIPGMRESIREGLATSVQECSEEPGW